MTGGVGASVPRLLLSMAAEYAEARKAGRPMDLKSIKADDPRIRNDPWYYIPGMWFRIISYFGVVYSINVIEPPEHLWQDRVAKNSEYL